MIIYDNLSGKLRNSDDVSLVEQVIQDKKTDPWKAIERVVEVWLKRSPEEFKGFKVQINEYKSDLRDRKFGTTKSKDQDRRLIMVFPQTLMQLIRSVFSPQELVMDREFYREFSYRFPFFRIPEKL